MEPILNRVAYGPSGRVEAVDRHPTTYLSPNLASIRARLKEMGPCFKIASAQWAEIFIRPLPLKQSVRRLDSVLQHQPSEEHLHLAGAHIF
jgi:hypothetical protein